MSEVKRYGTYGKLVEAIPQITKLYPGMDLYVLAPDYDALAAQRDEGLAREAELRKQSERLSILAAARLHDLNEIGKEIARAELAFRCALPFVQARCDETDYGDASARTTLEMIKELLKTFETSPGCADGEKAQ